MRRVIALLAAMLATTVPADAAGILPNALLTPGVATALDAASICAIKWGSDRRHVTAAMKRQVFAAYGLTGNKDPFCQPKGCEIDHLIGRELGGADAIANLWPQSYSGPWNARLKDRLENRLRREVCAGRLPLSDAQRMIRTDWPAAYRGYFVEPD